MKWIWVKGVYNIIESWCKQSGFHWDDEYSANVQTPGEVMLFNEFVGKKGNTSFKQFSNKGWSFYSQLQEIFPSGSATGTGLFHATCLLKIPAATQSTSSTSTPPQPTFTMSLPPHDFLAIMAPSESTLSATVAPSESTLLAAVAPSLSTFSATVSP
ncbi:hypothetical protein J3A83DRAFT_4373126 [Scleroderma citrinum]